jgi:hypothetical protein
MRVLDEPTHTGCPHAMTRDDAAALRSHIDSTIGASSAGWPGGWPGNIELALIDVIFSVRARYGDRARMTGVYGAVSRWREHRRGQADDLHVLAATPEVEVRGITNAGRLAGRSRQLW